MVLEPPPEHAAKIIQAPASGTTVRRFTFVADYNFLSADCTVTDPFAGPRSAIVPFEQV